MTAEECLEKAKQELRDLVAKLEPGNEMLIGLALGYQAAEHARIIRCKVYKGQWHHEWAYSFFGSTNGAGRYYWIRPKTGGYVERVVSVEKVVN